MRRVATAIVAALAVLTIGAPVFAQRTPPSVPTEATIPAGELGTLIRLGRDLVERTDTHPLSRAYVANRLRCGSCHLGSGTDARAATFIGVATAYPAWSPREKAVITLEDRVANCFMRSMGGVRPPLGSTPIVAITAYITWLSQGLPIRMNPVATLGPYSIPRLALDVKSASTERGAGVYAEKCAACHGQSGQGGDVAPPVWGAESYNMGAGLANVAQLAGWLKVAMPPADRDLSDQEALDVAAHVDAQPRPSFVLRQHLPPPDRLGVYTSPVTDEVRELKPAPR